MVLPAFSSAVTSEQFNDLRATKGYSRSLAAEQLYGKTPVYRGYMGEMRKPVRMQKNPLEKPRVKFRGIWGFAGDNETDGYITGVITKGKHAARLYGIWNETNDSGKKGKIIGVLKRGYFNGRVVTENGTSYHIAGIYRVDREHHLLKIRWIMPRCSGWAVLKIKRT